LFVRLLVQKMQFFFIYAALLVLPFVAFAEQLRKENQKTPSLIGSKSRPRKSMMSARHVGAQAIVGSFPTTPKYVSVVFYDDQACTGEINSVMIRMTDTCFTDGVTSEKFTCGNEFLSFISLYP
jgi:hypothetical protein